METRREERIGQLLQELKRSDKLHLKDAAALLGVSEMTIRRDLNNHSAPVVLLGGYIVLEPRSASHYLLAIKNPPGGRKTPGGKLAATLVEPDQTLFLTVAPPHRGLLKRLIMKSLSPPFVIR